MKLVKKFQDGGMMAPQQGMPQDQAAMGQEQDPLAQIVQLFVEGLQTQNCELLAQGAAMFLELVQQAQGAPMEGGAAPAEGEVMPAEGAAAGQPVFAKGGKLIGRKRASLQLVRK